MSSLRAAAQAILDSLDRPDSAVERLRFAKLVATLREEITFDQINERNAAAGNPQRVGRIPRPSTDLDYAARSAREWAEKNSPGARIVTSVERNDTWDRYGR